MHLLKTSVTLALLCMTSCAYRESSEIQAIEEAIRVKEKEIITFREDHDSIGSSYDSGDSATYEERRKLSELNEQLLNEKKTGVDYSTNENQLRELEAQLINRSKTKIRYNQLQRELNLLVEQKVKHEANKSE